LYYIETIAGGAKDHAENVHLLVMWEWQSVGFNIHIVQAVQISTV